MINEESRIHRCGSWDNDPLDGVWTSTTGNRILSGLSEYPIFFYALVLLQSRSIE